MFAVPGPVFSELSGAPLGLIRDGATLIRGPQDLIEDLGLEVTGRSDPARVRSDWALSPEIGRAHV